MKIPSSRIALLVATLLASASCQARQNVTSLPARQLRFNVMFVGNSLTYTNDLPGTLVAIAHQNGDSIRVAMAALPNYALIDHFHGGSDAEKLIAQGGWDYVVLQQGPTSLGINRDSLILWTGMFDERIRAVHARTALYMVWPSSDRMQDFDSVVQSYALAAESVNGVLMPVGTAWRKAWAIDSHVALYGPDGFHPSELGTLLAAFVMYEKVTTHDARSLPAQAFVGARVFDVPAATIRLLQRAAHEANETS